MESNVIKMRLVVFAVVGIIVVPFSICNTVAELRNDVVYMVEEADNHSICTASDAQRWSYEFHNCFIDRKYKDGGRDLNNIVDRILEHSGDCIKSSTQACRPNFRGFRIVMDKVIKQIKDYCSLYLEDINHGRDKIKDLDCVESSLSYETYAGCFKPVFLSYSYEEKFQKKVETAISCTNEFNKLCSKAAKTSLNRMARTILGVKQPEKEDIEDDVEPPRPWKWYDYIIQPFISAWNAIKSFFG